MISILLVLGAGRARASHWSRPAPRVVLDLVRTPTLGAPVAARRRANPLPGCLAGPRPLRRRDCNVGRTPFTIAAVTAAGGTVLLLVARRGYRRPAVRPG